ncbi:MAG: hypothetical protein Q7K39_00185 [Candidatus Magasanikbacteria bacterium]|nr:hypothetical protein [Candidatus Magasanikbacteria bacterium]
MRKVFNEKNHVRFELLRDWRWQRDFVRKRTKTQEAMLAHMSECGKCILTYMQWFPYEFNRRRVLYPKHGYRRGGHVIWEVLKERVYFADTLEPAQEAQIVEHLSKCVPCRAFAESEEQRQRQSASCLRQEPSNINHYAIRIPFEIEGRCFEAVGFLRNDEAAVYNREAFVRTAGENGGPIKEEDEAFLLKHCAQIPWKLRPYWLITAKGTNLCRHGTHNYCDGRNFSWQGAMLKERDLVVRRVR